MRASREWKVWASWFHSSSLLYSIPWAYMQVANKDQHLTLLPNSFFYSRSIWFREISREKKKNKDLRNFEKKNNLISIVDHFEGRMGISNWFQHKFSDPLLLVLRGYSTIRWLIKVSRILCIVLFSIIHHQSLWSTTMVMFGCFSNMYWSESK